MLVMLLNVKIHVLVKLKFLQPPSYLKDCSLVTMVFPVETSHCPPRRRVCRVPVHLSPILGLAELLYVTPPARFHPASMEDVANHDHIDQETGLKKPVTLYGLKALGELGVGQVNKQYGGPTTKLVVD